MNELVRFLAVLPERCAMFADAIAVHGLQQTIAHGWSSFANRDVAGFLVYCAEARAYRRAAQTEFVGECFRAVIDESRVSVAEEVVTVESGLWTEMPHTGYVLLGAPGARVPERTKARLVHCARSQGADLVYCDEIAVAKSGYQTPYLKPEFSYDLFCFENYIGPVVLLDAKRARSFLQPGDDLCTGMARMVHAKCSIARVAGEFVIWERPRPRAYTAQQRQSLASVLGGAAPPAAASITVVIPTRDRIDLLQPCIESVFSADHAERVTVVVVDNGSVEAPTKTYLQRLASQQSVQVVEDRGEFNWSRLNNLGRREAHGDVLLFVNNDIVFHDPQAIARLAAAATVQEVGVAGIRMHYPNGNLQHAGIVVGIGGFADHVYRGMPCRPDDKHWFVSPYANRNVLANTGACLAVQAARFDALGGFDEKLVVCGDLDLGLRAHARGYRNIYLGEASVIHHEAATRKRLSLAKDELAYMQDVFRRLVPQGDPFYNPSFELSLCYPIAATTT